MKAKTCEGYRWRQRGAIQTRVIIKVIPSHKSSHPCSRERRQQAEDTTTTTHTRSDQTFPFLDISSGNFRISFYIINRSRVKMCRRFFLNEIFYDAIAQSRHDIKESIFEWNSSFSRDFPLVAFDVWMCSTLHAIPISGTSSYLFLISFEWLSRKLLTLREKLWSCYVCLLSYYLATSIVGRFGRWRRNQEIFLSLAPCWKSLRERKLSFRKKILERKCSGCMILVN